MNEVLEAVRAFADKAHGAQMRKYTPDRYIVHPVRVMDLCRRYSQHLPLLAAALLHDVLEDTAVDEATIRHFLLTQMTPSDTAQTMDLVLALTDVYTKANYPHLNRRQRRQAEAERIAHTSADAQTIKYADIIDNCNEIVQQDPDFAVVFLRECNQLLQHINKGNTQLYQQAKATVNEGLKNLQARKRQH